MTKYNILIQNPHHYSTVPNQFLIRRWVEQTLKHEFGGAEVCIRIVDEQESAKLNHTFRNQNKATNVLSFPSNLPNEIAKEIALDKPILGDIVVCAPLLEQEARDQGKPSEAHWAHLLVHALLHLLGYDHIKDTEAQRMEQLEIDILQQLGYSNPYD